MFKLLKNKIVYPVILFLLLGVGYAHGQITPTNEWVSFYSEGDAYLNHEPLPEGSIIRVYDPDSVLCGVDTVKQEGSYGLLPVYHDDPETPETDEGAEVGDTLRFTVNGKRAVALADSNVWTSNGDVIQLGLRLNTPDISINDAEINIGSVELKDSTSTHFKISNPGNEQLSVDSIKVQLPNGTNVGVSEREFALDPDSSKTLVLTSSPRFGKGSYSGTFKIYSNAYQNSIAERPLYLEIISDVQPTNEWISIYSDGQTTLGGDPVEENDMVDVYDPDEVHIGSYRVDESGSYGLMSIYRDDPNSDVDEGAEEGDTLRFEINGYPAQPTNTDAVVWTSNGDVQEVHLEGIENKSPVAYQAVSDTTVEERIDSLVVISNVEDYFRDPDGDELTFTASSTSDSVEAYIQNRGVVVERTNNFIGTSKINVTADDGTFSTTLSFEFTVVAAPIFRSPVESVDFDTTGVDTSTTREITLYNEGSVPLVFHEVFISTDIFSADLAADDTVEAGSSLTVHLTFDPSAAGSYRDSLVMRHNGIASPYGIILTGVAKQGVPVEDNDPIPDEFTLQPNYPNPFNPSTRISYDLPKNSHVRMEVYNSVGRRVQTLVDERQSAGSYTVKFNAGNLPSGVYMYRLDAGGFTETNKMMLIK